MQDDLDADDRALIQQLRDLPPEGTEPDWQALEAAIRARVGAHAPRPWWRNWRWIVPVWTLATTAVVMLLVIHHPAQERAVHRDPPPVTPAAPPAHAMWLDGEALDLDDVDEPSLDALDGEARAALDPDDDVSGGILPVADYGWIDTLDEGAIDRAETWLQRKRS